MELSRGTFVTAHIIRDFKGVDPLRYHAAVRLQAESVPLNVAKNAATRAASSQGQSAPSSVGGGGGGESWDRELIEGDEDIFFDAESDPSAPSDPKVLESSGKFDSSADLFDDA